MWSLALNSFVVFLLVCRILGILEMKTHTHFISKSTKEDSLKKKWNIKERKNEENLLLISFEILVIFLRVEKNSKQRKAKNECFFWSFVKSFNIVKIWEIFVLLRKEFQRLEIIMKLIIFRLLQCSNCELSSSTLHSIGLSVFVGRPCVRDSVLTKAEDTRAIQESKTQ